MFRNSKKITAYILAAVLAVSSMAGVAPKEAEAAQTESPSIVFTLSDTARIDDVGISVTDESGNILNGSTEKTGTGYGFTAEGLIDDEGTFYYEVRSGVYEPVGRTAFTFAEGDIDISLTPLRTGAVSFVFATGEDADPDSVFFMSGGKELQAEKSEGAWLLEGAYVGDTVDYRAVFNKNGKEYTDEGSFTAKESGNSVTLSMGPVPDLKELVLKTEDISIIYGDTVDLSEKVSFPEDYQGKVTYEAVSGQDKVIISGTEMSGAGAGDAVIRVSAGEDASYMEGSAEFKVKVEKKNIGTISPDDVEWESLEKIYDGSSLMDVSGTVKSSAIGGPDTVMVKAVLIMDSADAGMHQSTLSNITFSGTDNVSVSLPAGSEEGPSVLVSPCPVSLSLKDITAVYGSAEWAALKEGLVKAEDILESPRIEGGAAAGFDLDEAYRCLDVSILKDLLKGSHEGAVKAVVASPEMGNYTLSMEKDSSTVTILGEQTGDRALEDNIVLSEEESLAVYDTGNGRIYMRPDSAAVFMSADDKYDTVIFSVNGQTYRNVLTGLSESSGPQEGTYYLMVDGSDTRTDAGDEDGEQDFILPSGYIYIDADAPEVSIALSREKETSVISLLHNFFTNSANFTARMTAEDPLSGTKEMSYKVVSYRTEDDLRRITASISASDEDWAPVPENGTVYFREDANEGNYAVLVMASDMVGNISITSSTGIVLDMTAPELIVTGIKDGHLYSGDVTYSVNVSDPGENASGIESIAVTVEADGKKKEGEKDSFINSFALDQEDIDALKGPSSSQETADADMPAYRTDEGLIHVEASVKDVDSNRVKVTVTVSDRSGNTYSQEHSFMVDKSAPVIEGRFTDTGREAFYSKDRILQIYVKERNYDRSLVSFDISVDGNRKTYSVESVREGMVPGVSIEEGEDAQKDLAAEDLTDDRRAGFALKFAGEHSYEINVQASDLAGNSSAKVVFTPDGPREEEQEEAPAFIIDKTDPEIEMLLFDEDGNDITESAISGRHYTDRNVHILLKATEKYFTDSRLSPTLDVNGDLVGDEAVSSCRAPEKWTRAVDGSYTFRGILSSDGAYTFSFGIKDPAGNTASVSPARFTIDRAAPSITLHAGGEASTTLFERLYFRIMGRSPINVDIDADDEVSGVKSLKYIKYDPGRGTTGTFAGLTGAELVSASWHAYNGSLFIDPDSQAVVYARAEDYAGNVAYISSSSALITEASAPSVTFSGITEGEFYNGNVPVSVNVTDPMNGGTWSGLAEVTCVVTANGAVTHSETYTSDESERTRDYSTSFTIDGKKNNSDSVTVTVSARDHAGNRTSVARNIMIDTSLPQIEINYDKSDARNGFYYSDGKTVNVIVRERNFDPAKAAWNITSSGGAYPEISAWTRTGGEGDNTAYTATVSLKDDAAYTLGLTVTDNAGNRGTSPSTERLVIDRTPPEVRISFDSSAPTGNRYYNKERTARITVIDANFTEDLLANMVSAYLGGQRISAPAVSHWSHNGSEHTATLIFNNDGEYSIRSEASDLAGNKSRTAISDMFIIDTTPPQIQVSGIKDRTAYRDSIYPIFTATDMHFLRGSIRVEVKGSANGLIQISGTRSLTQDGEVFTMEDIPKTKENDDVYTFRVSASDQAGNVSEELVTVSINRFGSSYQTDDRTAAYIEKYYHTEGTSIVVYETNLDEIKGHTVIVSHNGALKTLVEGRDYRTEKAAGNGSWKQLKYTIFEQCFAEEGLYEVRISTEDAAGNLQDNTTKSLGIAFVVDKTLPTISVSGLEDKGVYNEASHVFYVSCDDDTSFDRYEVTVDGIKMEGTKEGEYVISQKDGWQDVTVTAYDSAGNSDEKTFSVYVNTSRAAAFLEKNRLFVIGIPIMLLLALLGIAAGKKVKNLF